MQENRKAYEIVPRQLTSLVASTIIGVGVLTLPRDTTEIARESGWISVILGALFACIAIFFITKLGLRFPGKTIVEYSAQLLGGQKHKWIGKVLSFPLIIVMIFYFSVATVIASRTFGEVVVTAVLRRTPLEIIIVTMLLLAFLMSLYEVDTLARINELLLPIILIPIFLIGISSYQSAEMLNILPIFPVSWLDFVKGAFLSTFAYNGFEILLFLLGFTKIDKPKDIYRYSFYGILFPAITYTMIVLSGILVFGYEELQRIMWPTLELVKTTQVPGFVLERLESAFLGVWVAAVFTTVANSFFILILLIQRYLGLKKRLWISIVFMPLLFWLSLLPQNVHEIFRWSHMIGLYGGMIWMIVPPFLLILAVIRKMGNHPDKGGETRESSQIDS